MSSSTYSRYFRPQSISLILCLHEITKQPNQIQSKSEVVSFLVNKILRIPQESSIIASNQLFEAQLYSSTNDLSFLERYRNGLQQINSFNDFYREVSTVLKTLRTLRNNKLEQGNLVDFLIRRMYIYFEKLDFKEIVHIYETFINYKQGITRKEVAPIKKHQFMLTKSIEELKFNLENYQTTNPEQFNKMIDDIQQSDQTFKTSYLRALLNAEERKSVSSSDNMHQYFDKSLTNLFQQKLESQIPSNKINHCILSLAYANLEMGQIDQCLQSISEGLRISQNNSDEQSINNCIIYLYKIAEQLGKFRQQILLAEHAITHSLNLNNLTLMLYSCLSYSYFQKNYDCQDPALTILKSRHISWTEALHFAKKKIYSGFENNCKNIYHNHRNLLIPSFIHKLAILIHLPCLSTLLLNSYYDRPQLNQLQIHKHFKKESQIEKLLVKARRYFNLGQTYLYCQTMVQLEIKRDNVRCPNDIISIDSFQNQIKFQKKLLMDAYCNIQKLLQFCLRNGFVKDQYIRQLNLMNQILIQNNCYYDALLKIQQAYRIALKYQIEEQVHLGLILKAHAYLELGSLDDPIEILRELEQSGKIYDASLSLKKKFYSVKRLLNSKINATIDKKQFAQESATLLRNEFQCLEKILQINISQININKIIHTLKEIMALINSSPLFINKLESAKKTFQYVQKISKVFAETNYLTSNHELLIAKLQTKINQLYFRYQ